MPMILRAALRPVPPGLRFTAVDVPPPAPDVVPDRPPPPELPPEIREPLLPGQGEPVGDPDPVAPGAQAPRRIH